MKKNRTRGQQNISGKKVPERLIGGTEGGKVDPKKRLWRESRKGPRLDALK